ncbi:GIY-YIG nuclease family protein [Candidatus Saccharibacteria bacterium]|nr:MAG: GIY-YIG nuclease family protein [Candidatus Saccharibacteria bacterium]
MINAKNYTKPASTKRWTLYVLLLEEGKYYVGITSQTPEKRFQEHLHARKSYWTEKYPPIKIIQTVDLGGLDREAALAYENRVVRKYITEKGINNVRGGDITTPNVLVARFNRIFPKDDWEAIVVISFLILIILYQTVVLYIR